MGLALALLFFVIGSAIALYNWRWGIYAVVVAGFLQDPLRKIIPGEPVLMTVYAAALFGVCFISAMISAEDLSFDDITKWNPVLYLPSLLLVGWVCVMATKTLLTTGSPILAGIGATAYLAPIPGLLLGYHFARTRTDIVRLVCVYLVMSTLFCLSLYMEKASISSPLLGSVGEGFVFYPESGGISILYAGFFRSPEIAGWHAATGICLILLLGLGRKPTVTYVVIAAVLIAIFLPALIITGRRKFLAAIVMFIAFSGFLTGYYRFGLHRFAYALIALAIAAGGFYYYITASELPGDWLAYFERSATTSSDAADRFRHMTVDMFQWVIQKNGFFGAGAGTGSQGAQHFGGGSVLVGAAAEGGLGKVLAELGVPGLLLLVWVGLAMIFYVKSVCAGIQSSERIAPLVYCFVAFLGANTIVFTTAHQIFGDVFILLLLGLMIGFIMRSPYLTDSHQAPPLGTPTLEAPRRRVGRRFANRRAGLA